MLMGRVANESITTAGSSFSKFALNSRRPSASIPGFEGRDAQETPLGFGKLIGESAFFVRRWRVLIEKALHMRFACGRVICVQENGAAGQSGFDGVEG